MGFLDDLKKGADNLGNKLNESFSGQGGPTQSQAEPLLRDLGALTFLDQTGRLTAEQQPQVVRILGELQALEAQGLVIDVALRSAPPPPPGAAVGATPPPPPGASRARAAPGHGAAAHRHRRGRCPPPPRAPARRAASAASRPCGSTAASAGGCGATAPATGRRHGRQRRPAEPAEG